MTKLVSVIMATYNSEEFISKTIDSVLNQSYQNMEFIIVDDASTDRTREVIQSFSDIRIKQITMHENRHVCAACNLAFELARGDYIAFIGHDDIWEKSKIEKQIEFLERNGEYGICFSWASIIDESGSEINIKEEPLYRLFHQPNRTRGEWIAQLIKGKNCMCAASAVIRRDIFTKLEGYHYGLLQLQDYELWLKALLYDNIFVYPEELVAYRKFQTRTSLSDNTDSKKMIRIINEYHYIMRKFIKSMPDELFIEAFQASFKDKGASNCEEIACEKAFFLMSMNHPFYVDEFMELLNQKSSREILRDNYQLTEKGFYEMSKSRLYWDENLYEKQKKIIAEYELGFKQIEDKMSYFDQYMKEKDNYIKQLEEAFEKHKKG